MKYPIKKPEDSRTTPSYDDFDLVGKLKRNHSELPEATLLGKKVAHPETYDPSILVAVPRSQNREQYAITDNDFDGSDYWRCYEFSTLTKYGIPVYSMLIIQYPSNSLNIVESKSLKLYLNSFNMTKQRSEETKIVLIEARDKIKEDLTKILGTEKIAVGFSDQEGFGFKDADYTNLHKIVDYSKITSEGYNVDKSILRPSYIKDHKNVKWKFDGFRSNCKITNQPDYATVFIDYYGNEGIDPVSLIKYLTSFRNENHFHEECCELIFKDIQDRFNPQNLNIICNYTRRGGIDITPLRYTKREEALGGILWQDKKHVYFEHTPGRTIYQ